MPLERVSVGFKDLSMTFKQNPLNNDLIALKNENAIARSIRNIIFTYPGERFFNDNFGSKVSKLLFDNMDPLTAVDLRTQIISSTVNPNYQTNEFDTVIVYKIIGAEAAAQQLSFALQPTR
jgi:hypothetical protein